MHTSLVHNQRERQHDISLGSITQPGAFSGANVDYRGECNDCTSSFRINPIRADPGQVTVANDPNVPEEVRVVVTDFDIDGNVIGHYTETYIVDNRGPHESFGSENFTIMSTGCRSLDIHRTKYTALGFVAFKWHQTKYWCWFHGVVTDVHVGHYISENNGYNYFEGLVVSTEYFFQYLGTPSGGHYSMRQAQIDNCVFRYGCIYTWYPWVSINAYGTGGYSFDVGG